MAILIDIYKRIGEAHWETFLKFIDRGSKKAQYLLSAPSATLLIPLNVFQEAVRKFTIRGNRHPTEEEYKTLVEAYKTKDISTDSQFVFLDLLGSLKRLPAARDVFNAY